MRLWSVHPRYLDTAGLTACWREALLAQKVLTGVTRGYRHHPQLERFLPGSALEAHVALAPPADVSSGSVRLADTSGRFLGVAAGVAGVAAAGEAGLAAGAAGVAGVVAAGGWPGDLVVAYLHGVADDADARGFAFDRSRIASATVEPRPTVAAVEVTDGQLAHEWAHLRAKLAHRSPDVLARWAGVVRPDPHPCFVVVPGPVASWEVAPAASWEAAPGA